LFTVDDANRALPLVQKIVSDIVQTWEVVSELEQRLELVSKRAPKQRQGDVYDEEVAQSQAELEQERGTLQGYIEELKRIGVELKGLDGLCDFPSLRNGREVYLCWRLGEPSVAHWHEIDAGFAGRRPIEETVVAGPAHLGGSLN
jgi:hypothetical protein